MEQCDEVIGTLNENFERNYLPKFKLLRLEN